MASYRLTSDGESWPLGPGENLIGRYGHCQVIVESEDVAGEHARVDVVPCTVDGRPSGERLTLTDLGTPAGTFLDGVRVTGTVPLRAGQEIRAGSAALRLGRVPDRKRWITSLASGRRVRRAVKIAGPVFVAFLLLLAALRLVYNAERLRSDIVKALESWLGRDAEIGSIDYSLFGGRAEIRDLVVRNLPEFGTEPLLQAAGVVVRFRTGGFYRVLGGGLRAEVVLHQPVILVRRDERGRWNVGDLVRASWRAVRAGGEGFRARLPFSSLQIEFSASDATLRICDDLAGRSEEITGVTFEARLPGLEEPLSYRLEMDLPVADRPGRVSVTGEFRLFAGRDVHSGSVHGRILHLAVEELDLRALPGLPWVAREFVRESPSLGSKTPTARGAALDLKCTLDAAGLHSTKLHTHGRLGRRDSTEADCEFEADFSGDILAQTLEAGEVRVRGRGWEFASQGRVVLGKGGADVLDVDSTLRAPLARLARAFAGAGAVDELALSGDVELRLSTTGPTKDLKVRADASVSGLDSPATRAPPEDARISFRGILGLGGWSSTTGVAIDSVQVTSFSAEASFLHAALAPGWIAGLAREGAAAGRAAARLGPFEFDLDLGEAVRRYGPAIPEELRRLARLGENPYLRRARLHGWASARGEGGRIQVRHALELHGGEPRGGWVRRGHVRTGPRLEGVATLEVGAAGLESIALDERLESAGTEGGRDGTTATLTGVVGFKGARGEGPHLKLALASSGELSSVLEVARPYLGQIGSVWARGKFNLDEARIEGTPERFATRGRLELLGPELWGGSPTALPFSEPRVDVIWNVECDRSRGPVRLKVNVLRGTSSTLQFKLEAESDDVRRWLGSCDLRLFADFDRIGTVLSKLDLLPSVADVRGSMNVDLRADTREGRLELRSFSIDTPFLEARGGGEIINIPPDLLRGRPPSAKATEEVRGSISVGATLHMEGVVALARALAGEGGREPPPPAFAEATEGWRPPQPRRSGGGRPEAAIEGTGEVKLDLQAEGSGRELLVRGELDFDRFAGRLGRYVSKSLEELASLRFSASVAAGKPDLVTLQSGVLTLGGKENPARLELRGSLASQLDRFEVIVKSERFPVEPLAALVPELAPGAEGGAALNLRAVGRLEAGRLVPGSLELDGRADLHDAEFAWGKIDRLRGRFDGSVQFSGRKVRADGLSLLLRVALPDGREGRSLRFDDAGVLRFDELAFARDFRPGAPSGTFKARAEAFDLGSVLGVCSRGLAAAEPAPLPSGGPPGRERVRSDLVRAVISLIGFRADGTFAAEKVRLWAGGPELSDVEAVVSISSSRAEVKRFTCGLWGGRAEGRAVVDYSGGRLVSTGEVRAEGARLEELVASAGLAGALSGGVRGELRWTGERFTREDFERSWEIGLEAGTGEVSVDLDILPLAGEIRDAIDLLLGTEFPSGRVRARPATVGATIRRGRIGLEATELEFETGLRLRMSGRAALDGRLAGWVTVEGLPRDIAEADLPEPQREMLSRLAERGLLRFGVTGTWAAPLADVRALLWMLLEVPPEGEPEVSGELPEERERGAGRAPGAGHEGETPRGDAVGADAPAAGRGR